MQTKIFNKSFVLGVGAGIPLGILIVIGGLFVLFNLFATEESIRPPIVPSQNMASYDWTVRSLDGQEFNMADAKGKVVFLNVWATWCGPCRTEMPSIQSLYDKLKDEEIVFICVSKEDSETVSKFVNEKGYHFPIYTLQGDLPAAFQTNGIPTTFILSPDGKVALGHEGAAIWDDEKSISFIRGLKH